MLVILSLCFPLSFSHNVPIMATLVLSIFYIDIYDKTLPFIFINTFYILINKMIFTDAILASAYLNKSHLLTNRIIGVILCSVWPSSSYKIMYSRPLDYKQYGT